MLGAWGADASSLSSGSSVAYLPQTNPPVVPGFAPGRGRSSYHPSRQLDFFTICGFTATFSPLRR